MADELAAGWTIKLQCGHGSDAVETRRPVVRRARAVGFNAATAVTPWRHQQPAQHRPAPAVLQCGHGSDAVETSAGPRC